MEQEEGTTSLGHVPAGDKWAFDGAVTAAFDDMLRRSIPQHDVMRELVRDVARSFIVGGHEVVDLGCSRGAALAPLVADNVAAHYVGVEVSTPMLVTARERFAKEIAAGKVEIRELDLRREYPHSLPGRLAGVTMAVLTLQFVPIEYRQQIVGDVYRNTQSGGAFILVEKVLGATSKSDARLVKLYLEHKRASGYTAEEVERKRLSLEGVLVPQTAVTNESMLVAEGFRHVECFWRNLNFAAWVGVKE